MQPLAALQRQYALRAQHGAEALLVIQRLERLENGGFLELLRRLHADIIEDLVRVVVVIVVMMMVVMVMLVPLMIVVMVVVMLVLVLIMLVMIVLMVMMMVLVFILIMLVMIVVMMVMMLVLVLIVLVMIVVMVMMMVLVLVLIVLVMIVVMVVMMLVFVLIVLVMIVLMVMMVLVLILIMLVMIVVVVMMLVLRQIVQRQQEVGLLDGIQNQRGLQLVPRGSNDAGARIVLAQQRHRLLYALGAGSLGAAENNGFGALDLIVEELAEILNVHARLGYVRHGGAAREGQIELLRLLQHHAADIGQLAHARGLDQNAIGMVGGNQLVQRVGKVAHQRAADAARVELGNLNAGILHEAAVNADLTIFVFQQNNLLVGEGAVQQLFDQRGLARAEETGNNVDLSHVYSPRI